MKYFAIGYCISVIALSILAFFAYGYDKYRAKRNGQRVRERTLDIFALLGGWPGALVAQQLFRHKTQKIRFRLVFWICVVFNVIFFVGGLCLTGGKY